MAKVEINEFAVLMKDTRKRLGLCQAELGEMMTVSQGYISGVEKGKEVASDMFKKLFYCLFYPTFDDKKYSKKNLLDILTVTKDGVIQLNGKEIPQCLAVEMSDMRYGEPIIVKLTITVGEVNINYKP